MKIKLAGCIIQNSKGEILLLHRKTSKRDQWEIPGGKIDEGENPINTAKREVEEEINISVDIIKELGEKEFTEDGFTMDYIWYKAVIASGTLKIMEDKFDQFKYFSSEELQKIKDELSPNAVNFVNAYPNDNLNL